MANKIRVGIVGATVTPGGSGWGAKAHVPALQALPGYELKAVCTAHEETARASAEKFGAELPFHDMNEMVAHPDVDLIAVVVRVPLHKQLVMAAIEANKPVGVVRVKSTTMPVRQNRISPPLNSQDFLDRFERLGDHLMYSKFLL